MRYTVLLVLMAVLTLLTTNAFADPIIFNAFLNGANDNTPSLGTGFATVVLDPTAQTIQINVTFSGLTSNTTAAHIHCCPPPAPPASLGVATTVPAFPGFPLGGTAGTYISPVFDLTVAPGDPTKPSIYNPAFIMLKGGLAQAEAALIAGLESGGTYLNIHTVNFGGGEIRGQLTAVPEPTSLLLLGSGLVGLVLTQRRKLAKRS
jgi:hypothetical protein